MNRQTWIVTGYVERARRPFMPTFVVVAATAAEAEAHVRTRLREAFDADIDAGASAGAGDPRSIRQHARPRAR